MWTFSQSDINTYCDVGKIPSPIPKQSFWKHSIRAGDQGTLQVRETLKTLNSCILQTCVHHYLKVHFYICRIIPIFTKKVQTLQFCHTLKLSNLLLLLSAKSLWSDTCTDGIQGQGLKTEAVLPPRNPGMSVVAECLLHSCKNGWSRSWSRNQWAA